MVLPPMRWQGVPPAETCPTHRTNRRVSPHRRVPRATVPPPQARPQPGGDGQGWPGRVPVPPRRVPGTAGRRSSPAAAPRRLALVALGGRVSGDTPVPQRQQVPSGMRGGLRHCLVPQFPFLSPPKATGGRGGRQSRSWRGGHTHVSGCHRDPHQANDRVALTSGHPGWRRHGVSPRGPHIPVPRGLTPAVHP